MRKYRNKPTNGFASKREAKRAIELKLLERAGEISNLVLQPVYELIPKQTDGKGKCVERACQYRADFQYLRAGNIIVEDVKSSATKTPVYILKRKLLRYMLGIAVEET